MSELTLALEVIKVTKLAKIEKNKKGPQLKEQYLKKYPS